MEYLIIIQGDWNDGDYVYRHINTPHKSFVEMAELAWKELKKLGPEYRHNYEDFLINFSDDAENVEDFDYESESSPEVVIALEWLAQNVPFGYNQEIHTVTDVSIYEINKQLL